MPIPFDEKKELARIRETLAHLSPTDTSQRAALKERIRTVREYAAIEQMSVAKVLNHLFERIHTNPDAEFSEFEEALSSLPETKHLSDEQKYRIENGIREYQRKHAAVERMWQQASTLPQEEQTAFLYRSFFNMEPKGSIEVKKGPMTFFVITSDDEDYARAYHYEKLAGDPTKLDQDDTAKALQSGGAALRTAATSDLSGTITIIRKRPNTSSTERHEEQHQFDRIFQPQNIYKLQTEAFQRAVKRAKKDPADFSRYIAQEWMKLHRNDFLVDADDRSRTELLSFTRGGTTPADAYHYLAYSPNYDYLKQFRESEKQQELLQQLQDVIQAYRNSPPKEAPELAQQLPQPDSITIDDIKKSVFALETDYRKDLKKRTESIHTLVQKGYNQGDIIALFYSQPVAKWPSIARHIPYRSTLEDLVRKLPKEVQEDIAADPEPGMVRIGEYIGEDTQKSLREKVKKAA